MGGRRVLALLAAALAVTSAAALARLRIAGPRRERDGFFGITGVVRDLSHLRELGVDVHSFGFFVGADPGYVGSPQERRNTRVMRWVVGNGSEPLAAFWVPEVRDPDATFRAVEGIVRYYTEGEGAARVGRRVTLWMVGNEENGGWGTSCGPEEFARRFEVYASAIKEACPDCTVVMGGLLDESSLGPYLRAFLDTGAGRLVDAFNFHYYGLAAPSERLPGAQTYLSGVRIYREVKEILSEYGLGDRQVWVQETSTFSGCVGEICQTEVEQAADLVKRFVTLRAAGAERVFWCYVEEPSYEGTGRGFFDQSGLIYDGRGPWDRGAGVKKRGFYAYRTTSRLLGSARLEFSINDSLTYLFKFSTPKGPVSVVWQDWWVVRGPGQGGPLVLEGDGTLEALDLSGEEIALGSGSLELFLGKEPVFVLGEVSGFRYSGG